MPHVLRCPHCGKSMQVPDHAAGKTVRCPNPKCQKFMLVEEHDRNKVVLCLLCKTPIKVGGAQSGGRG